MHTRVVLKMDRKSFGKREMLLMRKHKLRNNRKKRSGKSSSDKIEEDKVQDEPHPPESQLMTEEFTCPSEYQEWLTLGVPLQIIRGLVDLKFSSPTEIQRQVIPAALKSDKDVVGAAETGSGKTLAFGIPILNHILLNFPHIIKSSVDNQSSRKRKREEIVNTMDNGTKVVDINEVVFVKDQYNELEDDNVQQHRNKRRKRKHKRKQDDDNDDDIEEEEGLNNGVGLLDSNDFIPDDIFRESLQTGKRISEILAERAASGQESTSNTMNDGGMVGLILTPTRELAMQIKTHIDAVAKYTGIKSCAVVGGMSTQKQERLLSLRPQLVIATPGRLWKMIKEDENPHLNDFKMLKFLVLDEADRMVEHGHFNELSLILERLPSGSGGGDSVYRTMVFSATLTLPKQKTKGKKAWKVQTGEQSVENLINKTSLSEDAVVIDLSTKKGTVDRLTESKIMCSTDEKDMYLYYSILACKGRKLVFTNSLDCLNRLRSLLEALRLRPLPLHARMQQRQRLKNLDRFTSSNDGLMVASDVAARGLDIPKVEHVIHYQTPKNSEVYVHRSGRTARGKAEGTSIMLVAPEDLQGYRNICRTLNREQELDNFPIDLSILKPLRERVALAKRLDSEEHRFNKSSRNESWLHKTAKAMDIILDDEFAEQKEEKCRERTYQKGVLKTLRSELNQLLDQKIIPGDVSLTFPSLGALEQHEQNFSMSVEKLKHKKSKGKQ